MPNRPRLLVLNEYYWPGVEATAHLLTELCEALADEYDVTVITGAARGAATDGADRRGGVRIVRVGSTSYERRKLALRATNYLTYVSLAARATLSMQRPDIVICMTDPPFLGAVAGLVAKRFRAPLVVVSQDVFPEIAVELGKLKNRVIVETLRAVVGYSLRSAFRVVVIGERMRERVEAKGVRPERIRVIPNWVDPDAIKPVPKRNPWSEAHGLADKFVVMHSGNIGHAQDLDSLVRAATFLRDLNDVRIVIIGAGARHGELVQLAQRLEVDQVLFFPYQPRPALSESLSSADVHIVGLARGLSGFVVPSRLYGILSAGRPVIVAADPDSETVRVVSEIGAGIAVPPGRPERIAAAIRDAYDGNLDLAAMGERARRYATQEAAREVAFARYRKVLDEIRQAPTPTLPVSAARDA